MLFFAQVCIVSKGMEREHERQPNAYEQPRQQNIQRNLARYEQIEYLHLSSCTQQQCLEHRAQRERMAKEKAEAKQNETKAKREAAVKTPGLRQQLQRLPESSPRAPPPAKA